MVAAFSGARTTGSAGAGRTGILLGDDFIALVDPALHTDDAVQGTGFGETVVNRSAERLQRHLAFAVPFGTGNVSPAKTAGATDADAVGPAFHGNLHGALHGAAEGNAAFQLDSHVLCNKLGVRFRGADFHNVNVDLGGSAAQALEILADLFNFLALAANDKTRTGSVTVIRTLFQARSITMLETAADINCSLMYLRITKSSCSLVA